MPAMLLLRRASGGSDGKTSSATLEYGDLRFAEQTSPLRNWQANYSCRADEQKLIIMTEKLFGRGYCVYRRLLYQPQLANPMCEGKDGDNGSAVTLYAGGIYTISGIAQCNWASEIGAERIVFEGASQIARRGIDGNQADCGTKAIGDQEKLSRRV